MRFLFLLLFISSTTYLTGQEIKGKIVDEKSKPIFFATVALYSTTDSTLVQAESTDEAGRFTIKTEKEGPFYLQVTMLGYADLTVQDLGIGYDETLTLATDANLLETIEIKDKAPLLEQRADKLIVNVEGNITNTGGTLMDVMKKVPGMLVVRDRLSLAGSGSPTILLNGKSTQYMDVQALLRDMPGDNISKVEIIHQPGAEYEASGRGPLINIILKKNSLFGTNGTISFGATTSELWEYTTGLNLSHYAGKLNIMGGVGYNRNGWIERMTINRRLNGIAGGLDGNYNQENFDKATPNNYRANLRMDYDFTDKHRIGFETKYYKNVNPYTTTNVTKVDLFQEEATDYQLDTDNVLDKGWSYFSLNPYYVFEIDTAGQKMEFDVSYANYALESENTLTTVSNVDTISDVRRYEQPGDTKIYAVALDYTKPLNEIFEIKTGLKYSQANLDNDLRSSFRNLQGQFETDSLQSNHYLFDETIKAVYGKLLFNSGPWSGTAGLRYEDSFSEGYSITLDSLQTLPIKKFFPSASLSRKLSKALTATLSYSRRIDRPRYSNLNPFVFYLDPFTSDRGNPNLRPELTHSGKFSLTYEGTPFFNVEYKKSTDAIVEVTEQDQLSEEAFKTDVNFDDRTIFSTTLLFPLDFIPGISGYGGVVLTNTDFSSRYIGNDFAESKLNTTTFLQVNFELPSEIQAEIGGWYTSANQEGIFKSEYLYGTSFGISKKFLDRKLQLSFGIEDFVNRFWHANVDYQQDMDLRVTWMAPLYSLKAKYKFGNQHLKSRKKTNTSAAEELKRAGGN